MFKYEVKVKCMNCNNEFKIRIPKGMPVKTFMGNKTGKCRNCGCDTIESTNPLHLDIGDDKETTKDNKKIVKDENGRLYKK